MRISIGVNVPHRAGDLLDRTVQDFTAARRIEVSGRAGVDLRVAALIEERRKIADLQLEPRGDQQVGVRELQDERRLGVDEVRVLVPLHEREGFDAVPAHRVGQRGEVLESRDHLHLREGRRVRGPQKSEGEAGDSKLHWFHREHLRTDGRRGRRSRIGAEEGSRRPSLRRHSRGVGALPGAGRTRLARR